MSAYNMSRRQSNNCPLCGNSWTQDWEDPDECPKCGWPYVDEEQTDDMEE